MSTAARVMEERPRIRRSQAMLAVFAASFLLLLLGMDREVNLYDEGLVLADGMRVLAGDLIHRDYYSPYGPAAYYVMAGLMKLGDRAFLLARLYAIATHAGIVTVVFGILWTRTRPWVCLAFTASCLAWLSATESYLYPLYQTLLLALIGSWLLLDPPRVGHGRLVIAGACTGLVALFRYDAAFFVLVAHSVAILLLQVDEAHGRHRRAKAVVAYGCGTAAVFLPFAIAFLLNAPVASFLADIIQYPMRYYVRMRGLPIPGWQAILAKPMLVSIYLPAVMIVLGVWLLTRSRRRRPQPVRDDSQAQLFVVFTLLTAFVYYKGFVRAEPLHMTLSVVPASVLAAVIVDRFWDHDRRSRAVAVALLVVSLMPSALLAAARGVQFVRQPDRALVLDLLGARPGVAGCTPDPRWWPMRQPSHYALVARYLDAVVPSGEPIFVGLRHHDRIFINAVALYYTANRPPATHWHQFDPGQQTREDVQRAVIADLERSRARYVVRDASYETVSEPNESQYSSGVHLLDEYLDSHFRPVMGAGPVEVWLARDAAIPTWPDLPPECRPDRVFD